MSEHDPNDGCSTGCLTAILVICVFVLFVLLTSENSPRVLIILFLVIGTHCGIELRKTRKREKTANNANTDARALLLEINKDLLPWNDAQRISFSEYQPGKTAILQISATAKKIAILRYNAITESADLRVYDYAELKSWKTHIKKESVSFFIFNGTAITSLSVNLSFFHHNKYIEHQIILFEGSPDNKIDLKHKMRRLKDIQDFLTYIQPESR